MKKLGFLFLLLVCCSQAFAQLDFLRTTDGQGFRVTVDKIDQAGVEYCLGSVWMSMKAADIAFVELSQGGVFYYSYDKAAHDVNTPELKAEAKDNPKNLARQGGKVFIPIASSNEKDVLGRFNMRDELRSNYNLWKVVDTELEADFILEYFFDETGRDTCYFILKTRQGDTFYRSGRVFSVHGTNRETESRKSVERLCYFEMPRIWKNK